MQLCDIGVIESLPTAVARSYEPELTVAVDVSLQARTLTHCDSAFGAILRIQNIAEQELRRSSKRLADIVVRPGVENEWFDFSNPEATIRAGYENVLRQLQSTHPPGERTRTQRKGSSVLNLS